MQRQVGIVLGLGVLALAAACGDDDGATPALNDSDAVAALANGIRFAGGVARSGKLPRTTDGTVQLTDAATVALLEPGAAGLLPFDAINPHDDDGPGAVLLQFGDEDSHLEVPASSSTDGPGQLNLAFELDDDVCDELCNRRYTIPVTAALELEGGDVGAHFEMDVVLDCRAYGDEDSCDDGEQSEPAPMDRADAGGAGTGAAGTGADDAAVSGEPDAQVDAGVAPAEELIGAEGGSVELADGAAAMVPMGALSIDTLITLEVASAPAELPVGFTKASLDYEFGPHGTSFEVPTTIQLPYSGDSEGLQVFWLDDALDTTWEAVDVATTTFEGGVAEFETTHFSIYAVGRSRVTVVLPFPASVDAIALDDTHVYYINHGSTIISKVSKDGGDPVVLYEPLPETPGHVGHTASLAVDDEGVYFTGSDQQYNGWLYKVPLDGVPAGTVLPGLAMFGCLCGGAMILLDDQNVYFQNLSSIYALPRDGGDAYTVVDPTGTSPVDPLTGGDIGFPGLNQMASNGEDLFYTTGGGPNSPAEGWLMAVPVGGGTPRVLNEGAPMEAGGVRLDLGGSRSLPVVVGDFVYVSSGWDVWEIPIDGGEPTSLFSGVYIGEELVTDGTDLYFVWDQKLVKLPLTGGMPIELMPAGMGLGDAGSRHIALDDEHLFAITANGQSIIKVALEP